MGYIRVETIVVMPDVADNLAKRASVITSLSPLLSRRPDLTRL
jgi:hypothetical protein